MKHRKILFVCTGNTCRSPMAEAALRHELKKRKVRWYRVSSAGLAAEEGHGMSESSKKALSEAKIPFDESFASTQLTEKMINEAHAVICMTESQLQALEKYQNVTCFSRLCGIEIPDPYGQPIDVYRTTLRMIRVCLPRIIEVYCPALGPKQDIGEEE